MLETHAKLHKKNEKTPALLRFNNVNRRGGE